MPEVLYQDIQDIVSGRVGAVSAAEAHGILSGLLCVDRGADFDKWLECLADSEDVPEPEYSTELRTLFDSTRHHLEEFDFAFELLLPEDDYDLTERATALGEWCQGFLAGLGHAPKEFDWPDECTEILNDFIEIARLDNDADGESDETAFTELAEYVRVGAQIIRSELQPAHTGTLH